MVRQPGHAFSGRPADRAKGGWWAKLPAQTGFHFPGDPLRGTFHDEINVIRGPAQQQVPHGPSHQPQGRVNLTGRLCDPGNQGSVPRSERRNISVRLNGIDAKTQQVSPGNHAPQMPLRVHYGQTVLTRRGKALLQSAKIGILQQTDPVRLHDVGNAGRIMAVLQGPVQIPSVEQADDLLFVYHRPATLAGTLQATGDVARRGVGGQGLHTAA